MGLDDLLSPKGVIHDLRVRCKREALQALAERAEQIVGKPAQEIIATLMEREQLGSTGVGDGAAIPHGKIEGLNKITGIFARLETPVNFDSLDDQPVDLIFLLLAPENATAAHLKALARVARLLKDEDSCKALRGADSAEALFAIAAADQKNHAARIFLLPLALERNECRDLTLPPPWAEPSKAVILTKWGMNLINTSLCILTTLSNS